MTTQPLRALLWCLAIASLASACRDGSRYMCSSDEDCVKQYGLGPSGPIAVCDIHHEVCIQAPELGVDASVLASPDGGIAEHPEVDAGRDGGSTTSVHDGGGVVLPGGSLTRSFCSVDRLCWESPTPQGNTLNAVWARSESDVWAVGEIGTVIHWDGIAWSTTLPPTGRNLNAIWVSDAGEVWVVGSGGTILRYDGQQWLATSNLSTRDLLGVSGDDDGNVFVVGYQGTILHYAVKSGWSSVEGVTSKHLFAVWLSPAGEVLAVGEEGTLVRRSSGSWGASKIATRRLNSVWGDPSGNVYVVGDFGAIAERRAGVTEWNSISGVTAESLYAVRTSGSDVWATGSRGVFVRRTIAGWTATLDGSYRMLRGMAAGSSRWIAVGEGGAIRSFTPGMPKWSEGTGSLAHEALFGVWGPSSDNVWVVGNRSVIRRESGKFVSASSSASFALRAIHSASPSEVWAVGEEGVVKWNGNAFTSYSEELGATLNAVWADATGELLVGGRGGGVYRRSGQTWLEVSGLLNVSGDIQGIWGDASGARYAVGGNGTILHRPNLAASWSKLTPSTSGAQWMAVWGDGAGALVVVGTRGMILSKSSSGSWSEVQIAPTLIFNAVAATSASDVWVVGQKGVGVRFDGTLWRAFSTGTTNDLFGVWVDSENVFVVGDRGTILRMRR